ncbi:hypothetical protein C4578_04320 [Candidatus Microgenomates bacterium]|jgi:hypothetical protein|nr:MAG: hypothetical protein C4578_04320 [Candidatus Microgenomates bacterium]
MVPLEGETVSPITDQILKERGVNYDRLLESFLYEYQRRARKVYGRSKDFQQIEPFEQEGDHWRTPSRCFLEIGLIEQSGERKNFIVPVFTRLRRNIGEDFVVINPDGSVYLYDRENGSLSGLSLPNRQGDRYPLVAGIDGEIKIPVVKQEETGEEDALVLTNQRRVLAREKVVLYGVSAKRGIVESLSDSLQKTTTLLGGVSLPRPLASN